MLDATLTCKGSPLMYKGLPSCYEVRTPKLVNNNFIVKPEFTPFIGPFGAIESQLNPQKIGEDLAISTLSYRRNFNNGGVNDGYFITPHSSPSG